MEDYRPASGQTEQREEQAMGEPKATARAATVGVADFSEQLSSGVLRALDAHARLPQTGGGKVYKPWIWAGIWIGPHDGGGPFGGGTLPGGGGINQG
jgi:hypothetical protein